MLEPLRPKAFQSRAFLRSAWRQRRVLLRRAVPCLSVSPVFRNASPLVAGATAMDDSRSSGSHQSSRSTNALFAGAPAPDPSPTRACASHQSSRGANAWGVDAPPVNESPAQASGPRHIIHARSGSRQEQILRTIMKESWTSKKPQSATDVPCPSDFSVEDAIRPVLRSPSGSDLSTESSGSSSGSHEAFGPTQGAAGSANDSITGSAAHFPIQMAHVSSDDDQGKDEVGAWTVGSAKHAVGECKPCAYARRNTCRNGRDCRFCNLQHPKTNRPRPCKQQRAQVKRVVAWMQRGDQGNIEQLMDDLRGSSSDGGLKQGYLRHYLAVMARMQETREDGFVGSPGAADETAVAHQLEELERISL